jgi:hypothetical protein
MDGLAPGPVGEMGAAGSKNRTKSLPEERANH